MSTDAFIEELHELAKAAQVELTPYSVWHGARVTWAPSAGTSIARP